MTRCCVVSVFELLHAVGETHLHSKLYLNDSNGLLSHFISNSKFDYSFT